MDESYRERRLAVHAAELSGLLLDVLKYGIGKALPGLASLLTVVVLMRLVGAEVYGRFALALAGAVLIASLATAWLNQAQLRYFSYYRHRPEVFALALRAGRRYALLAVPLLVALAAVLGLLTADPGVWLMVALTASLVALQLARLAAFQARLQAAQVLRLEALRALGMVLLPWLLAYCFGADERLLLLGVASAYGLSLLLPRPRTASGSISRRRLRALLRRCWRYGWPLSLWLACMLGFPAAERYLIQHYHGFAATGSYASVQELTWKFYALLSLPVVWAVHPRVMQAWNAGEPDRARRLLRLGLAAQLALFAPLLAICLYAAPQLLAWLLPAADPEMAGLMPVLLIAALLWQTALLVHKPLELAGATRHMLVGVALALLLVVALNVWGLRHYGVAMAAWSGVTGAAFYVLFTLAARRRWCVWS